MPATAQAQRGEGEQRRETWQKVGEIFEAMSVTPGAVVADVGAGSGFFTSRLAAAVGPEGKVLAVDVGADPLRRLRERAAREEWTNVEIIEGALDDPKLPAGAVDAILIVNAYHEMTEFRAMLAKMKAALKPGGRLVIVEPISESRRGADRAAQTRNHEIGIEFVKQDVREAGFEQVSLQDPFTRRPNHDEHPAVADWILVLTAGTERTQARALWSATRTLDWEAPALRISIEDFKALGDEVLVLDVRDRESYRAGRLPGAVLLTPDELGTPSTLARLREETRPIVAYCT